MPNNNVNSDASNEKDPIAPGNGQPTPNPPADKGAFTIGDTQATNSNQYIADKMEITAGFGVNEVQQLVQKSFETFLGALGANGGRFGSRRGAFGNLADNPNSIFRKYGEAHNTPSFVNAGAEAGAKSNNVKLPETLEEISDWYCNELSDLEICFVQAAAVLHGAPVHLITAEANKLYEPIQKVKERRLVLLSEIDSTDSAHLLSLSAQKTWSKELQTRTYTTISCIGAKRLLWQDANTSGNSLFASRLLSVIAQESASSMGERAGQDFLTRLEKWSETLTGECGWRATRALGVVWYDLDQTRLRKMANGWAGSEEWWRAANLMDGAYEAEYAKIGEKADHASSSMVLDVLEEWVEKAHSSLQIYPGCAAARAYERIGQRFLQPALSGLDSLLHFPLREEDNEVKIPLAIFASAVWSYLILARFGYAREVLGHLASNLDRLSHQRQPHQSREKRDQRAICLEAMFNVFLFIATASLSGTNDDNESKYDTSQKLTEHPPIPDEEGKDVLLAGILAVDEWDWRDHLMTILCAMLVEQQAKVAFDLMRAWAEMVLAEQNSQALELRTEYIRFVAGVGKRVGQWDNDLSAEFNFRGLIDTFKRKLDDWRLDGLQRRHPLGAFAKDVLRQLNA